MLGARGSARQRRGGEAPQGWNEVPADAVYRITQQPRGAWSFEVEARPFGEAW